MPLSSSTLSASIVSALQDLTIEQDGETTTPFANANEDFMEAVIGVFAEQIVAHIQGNATITGTTTITGTAGTVPVTGTGIFNADVTLT